MPPRPVTAFSIALMTSVSVRERAGADAVGPAGDQEHQHDEGDQAVHERRVADQLAGRPDCAAARPDGSVSRQKTTTSPIRPKQREAQAARFLRRRARRPARSSSAPAGGLRIVGAQARLDHAVGDEGDDARSGTAPRRSRTRGSRPGRSTCSGSTRWTASLVNSTSTASSGLISMLTVKAPATAAKPSARPASGWRPTLEKGDAGERDQHQIAGIGGDAREDADEGQDVGQRPGRRDEHELADQRVDEARFLGDAGADHRHDHQADGGEAHEVRDQRRVHEADAVRR